MGRGDITRRYRFLRRLPRYFDASTPWLVVDGEDDSSYDWLDGGIGVFRTARYRNCHIRSYETLKPFSDHLIYFGTDEEHRSFEKESHLRARRFEGDFIQICRAFKRLSFVIGNQTFLFSLAEALKIPRLVEMSSEIPDVMPLGRMANCFVDEEDLKECLKMYKKELGI